MHPTILFDLTDPTSRRSARAAFDGILAAALDIGGTITGEHGIGTLKREWLEHEIGPVALDLHRNLKKTFDPNHILNPGKVLDQSPH